LNERWHFSRAAAPYRENREAEAEQAQRGGFRCFSQQLSADFAGRVKHGVYVKVHPVAQEGGKERIEVRVSVAVTGAKLQHVVR
jgi:hypothetical protein